MANNKCGIWRLACYLTGLVLAVGIPGNAGAAPAGGAPDLAPLLDAVVRHGCASDPDYRTMASHPCSIVAPVGADDPDAVIDTLANTVRQVLVSLSLESRNSDLACAKRAPGIIGGTNVGARSLDELADDLVKSAKDDAMSIMTDPLGLGTVPAGLLLSIPGITQVQYNYKGLANGPEIRTFRVGGHLDAGSDTAKLHLNMDGDVDGEKKLLIEYQVNYRTTKTSFPAWSPFLDAAGDVTADVEPWGPYTVAATAGLHQAGSQRNGVKVWHDYEYVWHAEKAGASPDDLIKQDGDPPIYADSYPFGGDWVGFGWGTETRFKQTRRAFVRQFSPGLAAMGEKAADAILMSLNVKHQTIFRFHVDPQGDVTGRGAVVYTLDPNLCALAVLTRQVNEQLNFMKHLPIAYLGAGRLAADSVNRFSKAWTAQRTTFTRFIEKEKAVEDALKRTGIKFTRQKLQHTFKHAGDFGVTGNASKNTLAALKAAMEKHISAPGTRAIVGEYRGFKNVTHFIDPTTGLNVVRDASGMLMSGWKLSPGQFKYVMTIGKLGGG